MSEEERANWQKIKNHFETLPEYKRDNMFYKRAVAICGGSDDPLKNDVVKIDISDDINNNGTADGGSEVEGLSDS